MATVANSGSFKKGHKTNVGIKRSLEYIKMLSDRMKGKKMPEQLKEKLRKINTGKVGYWKGKKKGQLSEETKRKMSISHSGDKCNFWKGGITKENDKIRNSLEINLWKKAVLERDNFTCQKTGQIGGRLVIHHINNFADFPELRTSIENGITLSRESHYEFHKIYGKKNNSREQLLEFINKKI